MNSTMKEKLHQWYVVERRSYRFIMKELGITNARRIKALLIESGIEIRKGSEAIKTQWEGNAERRQDQSKRMSGDFEWRHKPRSEEAKKNLSDAKRGYKNPMYGKAGKLHHHFLGGKETWSSGRRFSEAKRSKIFDALGRVCKKCNETEFRLLTINHIIPWRESKSHDINNLEILCKKCHFSGPNRLR